MAFLGKNYTLVKEENFDAFLRFSGVPESKITADKPTQKITQNGDTYTLTTTSSSGTKEITFKSGVEFDDVIGEENIPIKAVITVDGNTLTHVINGRLGHVTFKREFNGNDLVVTITGEKFEGTAKRYYKA